MATNWVVILMNFHSLKLNCLFRSIVLLFFPQSTGCNTSINLWFSYYFTVCRFRKKYIDDSLFNMEYQTANRMFSHHFNVISCKNISIIFWHVFKLYYAQPNIMDTFSFIISFFPHKLRFRQNEIIHDWIDFWLEQCLLLSQISQSHYFVFRVYCVNFESNELFMFN